MSVTEQIARALMAGERTTCVLPYRPRRMMRLAGMRFEVGAREEITLSADLTDLERSLIVELGNTDWLRRQRAYLVRHDIVGRDADEFMCHLIEVRYRDQWVGRRGWMVHLTPTLNTPRYLAPVSGYTTNPARAIDDLEVVDVSTLSPSYGQAAQARHRKAIEQDAKQARTNPATIDQRFARAKATAKTNGVDLHYELRKLTKFIHEARPDASIIAQLELVEDQAARRTSRLKQLAA